MHLLDVFDQLWSLMWPALMRIRHPVRKHRRPLPRSVCWNSPRLGCAQNKAEAASYGLEAAEGVFITTRRLICCTSKQLCAWWMAEIARQKHGLTVCVGALRVVLPLPGLPSPAIVAVECTAQQWRLEIRSHVGYLIAAELSQRLCAWVAKPEASPRKEIIQVLQHIANSLTTGSRYIELSEGQRTPLVCKWIRAQSPSCGSFSLRREFPGGSWARQPGLVILLGPARITTYHGPHCYN
jgi:hypothetical protein